MSDYGVVLTTTDSQEKACQLAERLVERELVACAQVLGPITSVYRWKGAVQRDEEWLCLLKTRRDLYGELESAIAELHDYEVPEIVMLDITAGLPPYLSWITQTTQSPGER